MIDIKPGQYLYACMESGEPTKYQVYGVREAVDGTYVIDTTYHSGERRFTDKEINAPDGAFLTQEELYKDMLNPRHLEECVRILEELKETKATDKPDMTFYQDLIMEQQETA